jgi:hypothetical protein
MESEVSLPYSQDPQHWTCYMSRPSVLLDLIKGKGKVVPVIFSTEHHAMKAYWGSGDIVLRILRPRH